MTSFYGYSGLEITDAAKRIQIADRVENEGFAALWEGLSTNPKGARDAIRSVDVSFNEAKFDIEVDLNLPTSGVSFNTCLPVEPNPGDPNEDDPDFGYKAYRLAVHEAGHALGMSGFSGGDVLLSVLPGFPVQQYYTAHPTIPDSAVNYDTDESGPVIRHPEVDADFAEPDCSPHPFDVAAIFALYQMVPIVDIAGDTSGNAGEDITLTALVSGGVDPYTYKWSVSNNAFVFKTNDHSASVTIELPNMGGSPGDFSEQEVGLLVKDDNGTETHLQIFISTYAT